MNRFRLLKRLLGLAAALVVLTACQSVPSRLEEPFAYTSTKQQFLNEHRRQARRMEAKGALYEARREWQLVHALSPPGSEADDQLERLAVEIDRRFARHLAAAEKAVARRQWQTAHTHLLRALALQPDNPAAISLMRNSASKLSYARLEANPVVARGEVNEEDAYLAAHDAPGGVARQRKPAEVDSPGTAWKDSAGNGLRGAARVKQGLRLFSREEYKSALDIFERAYAASGKQDARIKKYIAQTRQALADQHYELGVAAFRSARYADAVKQFQLVLQYAPDHHKARFYLANAKSLLDP